MRGAFHKREETLIKYCIKVFLILGILIILSGCATLDEIQNLRYDVNTLQSQLNRIRNENESLKQDLSKIQKESEIKISSLEKEVLELRTNVSGEMKKLQADLLLRFENLQSEMRILSTGMNEYREYLKKPPKDLERSKEDIALRTKLLEERGKTIEEKNRVFENRIGFLEERIKAIEDRFKGHEEKSRLLEENLKGVDLRVKGLGENIMEIQGKVDQDISKKPSEAKGTTHGKIEDIYKEAYETFQKGDFEMARKKFEAFLKQYPNTELSDNAQYWIGETYYLKKDFEKAILEYEKVILKYPNSDKIPAALLKQGLAFLELGDKKNGRSTLKRVIQNYPQSEQAEIAKKRLEVIK